MSDEVALKRRHPVMIVLQSLLDGLPVEMEGEEYWLDDNGKLVIKRESINTETQEKRDVFLVMDMNVGAFIKLSEKLPEADVITIAGNNVLNKVRRGELRRRK
jgi:hypothetical protein